jgi:hypothetical protein
MSVEATIARRDRQEKALRDAMSAADGAKTKGRLVNIKSDDPRGSRFLCGMPYLWTQFIERAYVIDEATALEWIETYNIVLSNAELVTYHG